MIYSAPTTIGQQADRGEKRPEGGEKGRAFGLVSARGRDTLSSARSIIEENGEFSKGDLIEIPLPSFPSDFDEIRIFF